MGGMEEDRIRGKEWLCQPILEIMNHVQADLKNLVACKDIDLSFKPAVIFASIFDLPPFIERTFKMSSMKLRNATHIFKHNPNHTAQTSQAPHQQ